MRNHCDNNINRLSKGGFCFLNYFDLTLLQTYTVMENPKTIEELDDIIEQKFNEMKLNFCKERGFYDDCYYGIVEAIWELFYKEKD